jgi:hypothetical protein
MRLPSRPLAHLLVAVGLSAALGALAASCGTDAVGVDACRQIESARCDDAPTCKADFDVAHCQAFYRDQCMHGIENAGHPPSDAEVSDCVAAIHAVTDCAKRGAANMKDCNVALVDGVLPATLSPCDVVMSNAHLLAKCAFAGVQSDAGTASPADAATTDAATTDAGAGDASAADASKDAG